MPTSAAFQGTIPSTSCTLITTPIRFDREENSNAKSDIGVHLDTGRPSILKRFSGDVATTCSSFSSAHKKKAETADSAGLKALQAVRYRLYYLVMRTTIYTLVFLFVLSFLLFMRWYSKKEFRKLIKPHVFEWVGDYVLKPFHLYALRSTKKVSSFMIFMSLFIIACSLLSYYVINNMRILMTKYKEMKERVESMKEYSFDAKTKKYDNNSDAEIQYLDFTKLYSTMPLSTYMLKEGLNSRRGDEDILYQVITFIEGQEILRGIYEKFCSPLVSLQQVDRWMHIAVFQSKLQAVTATVTSIQAEVESNVDGKTYDDKTAEIDACMEQSKTLRIDELITCHVTLHCLKSEWTHWWSKDLSCLFPETGKNDFMTSASRVDKEIRADVAESIAVIKEMERSAVERVRTVLAFAKDITGKTIDGESVVHRSADTTTNDGESTNIDTTSTTAGNKNDSSAALIRSKEAYNLHYTKAMNLICAHSRVMYENNASTLSSLASTIREIKTLHFVLAHKQSLLAYLRKPLSITTVIECGREVSYIESEETKMKSCYGAHPRELRKNTYYDEGQDFQDAEYDRFRSAYPQLAAEIKDYEEETLEIYGLKTRESGMRAITNNARIFRLVMQCHLIVHRLKRRCHTKKLTAFMARLKVLELGTNYKFSKASDYLKMKAVQINVEQTFRDWDWECERDKTQSDYQFEWARQVINGKDNIDGCDDYWEYQLLDRTEEIPDLDIQYRTGTKWMIAKIKEQVQPQIRDNIKQAYRDSLPKREPVTMEDLYVGNTVTWSWSVPDAEIEWTWPVKISEETVDLVITRPDAMLAGYVHAGMFATMINSFVGTSRGWKDIFGQPAAVKSHTLYDNKLIFHFSDFDRCLNFYKRFGGNLTRPGYFTVDKNGVATIHTDPEYSPWTDTELKNYSMLYDIELKLKVKDINGGTGNVRDMKLENLVSYNKEFDHAPVIVSFPGTTRLGGNYRLQNLNSEGTKHQVWKFIDMDNLRRVREYALMMNRDDLLDDKKQPPPAIVKGKPALYYVRAGAQASVDLPEHLNARIASGYDYYGPFFVFGPFGEYTKTHNMTSCEDGLSSTLKFPTTNSGESVQDMDYSNF